MSKRCLSCGPVEGALHCPSCGEPLLDPEAPEDAELIVHLEEQRVARRRRALRLGVFLLACLGAAVAYAGVRKVGPVAPGIAVCVFAIVAFFAMPRS